MGNFIYLECRIAGVLGISSSLLRSARRQCLAEGQDYRMVEGRMAYTEVGVNRLLEWLLKGDKTTALTREKVEATQIAEILSIEVMRAVPAVMRPSVPDAVLTVIRIYPHNSKIMLAKLDPEWIKANGAAYQEKTGIDPRKGGDPAKPNEGHRVQVRVTKKFTVGMAVPCRWKQADLWVCSCAMPRRKGKWL